MREIKFRAWNAEKQRMYYATYGKGHFETNGRWWAICVNENQMVSCTNPENKLMQYTGLKDNDGREIYESDIVTNGKDYSEVVFVEGGFCFKIGHLNLTYNDFNVTDTFEVIGNMCEKIDV